MISEKEKKFENYRLFLKEEAALLASFVALYRRLHERRADRLIEMNIAPAFFGVVIEALVSCIILWVGKLLDKHGERGIFNFLTFIEHNIDIFEIEQLKRRLMNPAAQWIFEKEAITLERIDEDRNIIQSLSGLQSFKTRRNKFYAHFDKNYFFDRERLAEEAPLTWGDLQKVIDIISEIFNRYSSAYDGQLFVLRPDNINDLDQLLDRLHECL